MGTDYLGCLDTDTYLLLPVGILRRENAFLGLTGHLLSGKVLCCFQYATEPLTVVDMGPSVSVITDEHAEDFMQSHSVNHGGILNVNCFLFKKIKLLVPMRETTMFPQK